MQTRRFVGILWPPHAKSWLIGKDYDAGRDWGQEEKGTTEDEMAGWHHRLDGQEFGWTPEVGDGQRGLACCNSWGLKESDMTEWLNWTELIHSVLHKWKVHINYIKPERSLYKKNILILNYQKSHSICAAIHPISSFCKSCSCALWGYRGWSVGEDGLVFMISPLYLL